MVEKRVEGGIQDGVRVHWYTPVFKTIGDCAAELSIKKYACATFDADFLAQREESRGGGPKLAPDLT